MLRIPFVLALVLLVLGALPSLAAAPRIQEVAGEKALSDGELESLSLDDEGVLRPGPAFEATELDAPTSWAALRVGDTTWIGTGNAGEVLAVDAQGEIRRVRTGDTVMVTALAPLPGGAVAAAVVPGGRIVKVEAAADVEPKTVAVLPAAYVWALLPDARGGLLAATGEPGALWRVDAFGAVEKLADVGDDHARCMVRRGDELLVGTAPKGRVLSIQGKQVTVLRDLEAQEVVGIVVRTDQSLLIAANEDQTGGNAQALANLLGQMMQIQPAKNGEKKAPERASLQNGQVLWLEPSGAVTPLWEGKKVAALSFLADGEGALLGTYPSGRLIHVEPGRAPAIVADLPEAEASVLLEGPDGVAAVVTSNPAVLHRRKDAPAKGTWTSAPLDGGAVARWGAVTLTANGVRALEVRSGETDEPDDAWTEWKPVASFDGSQGQIASSARFLQIRATLEGKDAQLSGLEVIVAAPNRAPLIPELEVKRPGKQDEAGIPEPTTVRQIGWKAEDPDGDRLSYRVEANREGSPHWIELLDDEVLDKPQWTWDTAGLPDGTYRVRVVATDAPDTPPAEARTTSRVSAPTRIDNTPPRVTVRARPAGDRLLVEGEVEDQPGGRVAQIRVCVDGKPWQVLGAADGLLDESTEAFAASLPSPGPGPHDVVVQSRDADGNTGAGATVVSVR